MIPMSIYKGAIAFSQTILVIIGVEIAIEKIKHFSNIKKAKKLLKKYKLDDQLYNPIKISKGLTDEFLESILLVSETCEKDKKNMELFIDKNTFNSAFEKLKNEYELEQAEMLAILDLREMLANFVIAINCLKYDKVAAAKFALKTNINPTAIIDLLYDYDSKYTSFHSTMQLLEKNYWVDKLKSEHKL